MYRMDLYFGHLDNETYYVDTLFKASYDESWFSSKLACDIMHDIDRVFEVKDCALHIIDMFTEKPKWISPSDLSSGTKALLIMLNTDTEFICLTRCGENCAKWVAEIAKIKPLKCTLSYLMPFEVDIPMHILNDDTYIETYDEYLKSYFENYGSTPVETEESKLYAKVIGIMQPAGLTSYLSEFLPILPVREYSDDELHNTINAFLLIKGASERV